MRPWLCLKQNNKLQTKEKFKTILSGLDKRTQWILFVCLFICFLNCQAYSTWQYKVCHDFSCPFCIGTFTKCAKDSSSFIWHNDIIFLNLILLFFLQNVYEARWFSWYKSSWKIHLWNSMMVLRNTCQPNCKYKIILSLESASCLSLSKT